MLTLTFSDSTTEHPVENNNGTWNFRRTEPFAAEVIHTATLIQTAAQQPLTCSIQNLHGRSAHAPASDH
ncbi:hypothetical protein [Pseudomonas sp. H1_D09]